MGVNDPKAAHLRESIENVMRLDVTLLYVGHGGPLSSVAVRRRFGAPVVQPMLPARG
jgi:glyoxylase-like metal-dependent hydrolase (beta-lactamase superfamily II)